MEWQVTGIGYWVSVKPEPQSLRSQSHSVPRTQSHRASEPQMTDGRGQENIEDVEIGKEEKLDAPVE
jgi:hypothetical protein